MKKIHCTLLLLIGLSWISCRKEADWLDQKPDKSLVIPTALQDFLALLSNEGKLNILDASLGFVAGEAYYIRETNWQNIAAGTQRNTYTWSNALTMYEGTQLPDWNNTYQQIYYCNVVMDGMKKIKKDASNLSSYNQVLGTALFFRSYAFYKLLTIFAAPFDSATAAKLPGIILPQTADVNEKRFRASVADCYDQVIRDLKTADSLLPALSPYRSRPSRTATKALLARICLSMRDYGNAYDYADKALSQNNTLLDYNTLSTTATYPVPMGNTEDIFHCRFNTLGVMANSLAVADSVLYSSYTTNDLRRTLFFKTSTGVPLFRGSYEGASSYYSGLATDEMYLIRAETNARLGRITASMQDLNSLLIKRWKTGTYIPMTATGPTDALQKILTERQKELIFRGLRWSDLRRLNTDPATAVTLQRLIGGETYTLPPGDPRYIFLLPDAEILLSGVEQNHR